MFTLPSSAKQWLQGLSAAIIGGGASAGQAWLGMSAAHSAGLAVPVLNWKSLGIIMLSAATTSMLAFLAKSPIPISTTTVTLTKEVTGTSTGTGDGK